MIDNTIDGINPEQEYRAYFKKVYLFFGVNFHLWYDTEDPIWFIRNKFPDQYQQRAWSSWLRINQYVDDIDYIGECVFTEKFIKEVVDNT